MYARALFSTITWAVSVFRSTPTKDVCASIMSALVNGLQRQGFDITCTQTRVLVYTHLHTHTHTNTHSLIHFALTLSFNELLIRISCSLTQLNACTRAHTNTHKPKHTHTRTHARTNPHTRAHTHRPLSKNLVASQMMSLCNDTDLTIRYLQNSSKQHHHWHSRTQTII